MGFLNSLFGGGLSAGGSALGALFSKKAADAAWRRQKTAMQNQVSWRVADLKRSGINPVLAAGAGLGGGGVGVSAVSPSAGPNIANDTFSASKFKEEMNLLRKESKVRSSTIGLNRQLANESMNRAFMYAAQGDYADAQKALAQTANISQTYLLEGAKTQATMAREANEWAKDNPNGAAMIYLLSPMLSSAAGAVAGGLVDRIPMPGDFVDLDDPAGTSGKKDDASRDDRHGGRRGRLGRRGRR